MKNKLPVAVCQPNIEWGDSDNEMGEEEMRPEPSNSEPSNNEQSIRPEPSNSEPANGQTTEITEQRTSSFGRVIRPPRQYAEISDT